MTEKLTWRLYGNFERGYWWFSSRPLSNDIACIEMDVIDGRPVAVRLVPLDDETDVHDDDDEPDSLRWDM